MPTDETQETRISRLREWVNRKLGTELPCGCVVLDAGAARYSDATTEVDRELHTTRVDEYQNCTKYGREWELTLTCDNCGAEWTERHRSGSEVAYSEPNPDADRKLESKMRGRRVIHNEKPVIRNGE